MEWAPLGAAHGLMAAMAMVGFGAATPGLAEVITYPLPGGALTGASTSFSVSVPDDVFIKRIEVRLALDVDEEDGFLDWLDVSLVGPTGMTVRLLGEGLLGDFSGSMADHRLQDTVFSELGTLLVEDGAPPYTGVFKVDDWTAETGLRQYEGQRSTGTWTIRVDDMLQAGGVLYGAGNLPLAPWSAVGSALIIHAIPPEEQPPAMAASSDTGRFSNDAVTADTTPTFTGVASAGATVTLKRDLNAPVILGTTVADVTTGAWSVEFESPLAEGQHDVFADVVAAGGGATVRTYAQRVTVDVTAPAVPTLQDRETNEGVATLPVAFVVGDNLSAASALMVTSGCSPSTLASQVVVGGAGAARNVVVHPAEGQAGVGVVTVHVTDLAGNVSHRSFQVTVLAVNKPPELGADTMNREAGSRSAKVLATELLANDTDADGDSLIIESVSSPLPAGASVKLAGPFVVYSVPMGTQGNGSFVYTVSDGLGGHLASRVVNVVEVAPGSLAGASDVAAARVEADGADRVLTWQGVPRRRYKVQFSTSTGSPHVWSDFVPSAEYTAAVSGALGVFVHRDVAPPEASRLYRAVAVGWGNEAPSPVADTVQRPGDSLDLAIPVAVLLANDRDGDLDPLQVVWVGNASPAGAEVVLDGASAIYSAPVTNEGPGSFEYEVSDGAGHVVRATVTVLKTASGGG